jgi:hypothetical protein
MFQFINEKILPSMKIQLSDLVERLEVSLQESEAFKNRPTGFRITIATLLIMVVCVFSFSLIELLIR